VFVLISLCYVRLVCEGEMLTSDYFAVHGVGFSASIKFKSKNSFTEEGTELRYFQKVKLLIKYIS
jgi:hypothetical protein